MSKMRLNKVIEKAAYLMISFKITIVYANDP